MGYHDLTVRPAGQDDAPAPVSIVEMASEGLVTRIWAGMAEAGETPRDVGLRRARRGAGSFSHTNATIATLAGYVQGGLIGYPITAAEEIGPGLPRLFVPLQELENLAVGSWYVNVLAVMPDWRGHGIGSRLLFEGERRARQAGCAEMSIIVSNGNPGARRLYERHGYTLRAERPMGEIGWDNPGTDWVLLMKTIA